MSHSAIAQNRKAYFNYQILEDMECGLCLQGTEIKSLRVQGCNLNESYVRIQESEAWLCQCEIPIYKYGTYANHDPVRKRKLLLHRKEINRLHHEIEAKNLSCIPLKIYLKNGKAKVLIGIGKSKKLYDKRQAVKKKSEEKEIARATKHFNRN